jgi:hypothetical protein
VLQFLPEIESDMSVFHRVDDIYAMEVTVFFRRVECLTAYDGAVAAQAARQQREATRRPSESGAAPVVAQADDEDALWDAYRQQRYAKFLKPGETPRLVSVSEGVQLASRALSGVN